ncbi:hypothetical protein QUB80_34360 [Chlorogloeopsis sp. ULAP01]|nr:hypothetical protein [Chlorogloeopsis sp. ULAP01]MDM9385740.1 hypothetical protein [Chlorogloeopsis sp. ULAP01]
MITILLVQDDVSQEENIIDMVNKVVEPFSSLDNQISTNDKFSSVA